MPLPYMCGNTKCWNTKCCDISPIYMYWHACQTQIVFVFQLISSAKEKNVLCTDISKWKLLHEYMVHLWKKLIISSNPLHLSNIIIFSCKFIKKMFIKYLHHLWKNDIITRFVIKVKYKGLVCLDVDRWHVVLYYESELTQAMLSKSDMKFTPWPGQEGQFHINMSKLINILSASDEIEMAK